MKADTVIRETRGLTFQRTSAKMIAPSANNNIGSRRSNIIRK